MDNFNRQCSLSSLAHQRGGISIEETDEEEGYEEPEGSVGAERDVTRLDREAQHGADDKPLPTLHIVWVVVGMAPQGEHTEGHRQQVETHVGHKQLPSVLIKHRKFRPPLRGRSNLK